MVGVWATAAILIVGFVGVTASGSDATTLAASAAVAPKGMSSLSGVSCPAVDHCVAVGAATGSTQPNGVPGAISTINGGASWSKANLQGGPNQVVAVSCATKTQCVGVGGDITASFAGTDAAGIIVTSDGGRSWTGHLLPDADGYLTGVSCPSSRRCVAVGVSTAAPGFTGPLLNGSLVFVSSDGGASWVSETVPNGTGMLLGVSCPSIHLCRAVGTSLPSSAPVPPGRPPPPPEMDVINSQSGGTSWTTGASLATGVLTAISCPNARQCVAIGTGPNSPPEGILTTDGGATWSSTTLPHRIGYLSSITCPSSRDCVAVGATGNYSSVNATAAAAYSLDGGRSWSAGKLPGPKSTYLMDVACSSVTRCVAVGAGPTAATASFSDNGGRTWR
jgi:hypothetical protein